MKKWLFVLFLLPVFGLCAQKPDSMELQARRQWEALRDLPVSADNTQRLLVEGSRYSKSSFAYSDSFFTKSIAAGEALGNDLILAVCYLEKGNAETHKDRYYTALQCFMRAKQYAQKIAVSRLIENSIKNGLAIVNIEMERFDSALHTLKDLYVYGKNTPDTAVYCLAMVNMGWCYYKQYRQKEAIAILREWV
jgi:tetratricopeptide (TPR) repeat protein